MADGVTQLWCGLCSRLKHSNFDNQKLAKMSSVFHLFLASLTGVLVALLATYIPSIFTPISRPSLEANFNLILAPESSPEQGKFI